MKKLVVPLLVSLMASVAFAGLDPDPDQFGIYFDTQGNTVCGTAGPFVPTTVYLLLMNPRSATNGFECTVTATGVPHFILSTTLGGAGALDVDASQNGFAVGAAANYPVVSGACVLVTFSLMLQTPGPLVFHIGPASIPSLPGGLPVVTGDGVLRLCGVASGDVNVPVAGFNTTMCGVSEEARSFGEVKSLFR